MGLWCWTAFNVIMEHLYIHPSFFFLLTSWEDPLKFCGVVFLCTSLYLLWYALLRTLGTLISVYSQLCFFLERVPSFAWLLSALDPESSLKAVSWDNLQCSPCFLCGRVHSPLLPDFLCLAYLHFIYFPPNILIVSHERINLVPLLSLMWNPFIFKMEKIRLKSMPNSY